MTIRILEIGALFGILTTALPCAAEIRPEKVHIADTKKTSAYIREGLVTGGDRAIDGVIIRDIRRAPNGAFERVVVDLEGTRQGEPTPIPRPPYFQIAVQPEFKRLTVSIWGKPRLGFDAGKVVSAFKKSQVVQSISLFPKVEDELWTFALELKENASVEIFELGDQARLILDIGKGNSLKPNRNFSETGAKKKTGRL